MKTGVSALEGGQFCPQPAFSVGGRGPSPESKTQGHGGGIYPARGFGPALVESVGCGRVSGEPALAASKAAFSQNWLPHD
jgi:hypothetical protein